MPAYRFPKPHPLSPDTKTWTENGVRYKRDKGGRGGKSVVIGVETKRSIYYWWYEYLRLSKLYQKRCGIQVTLSEEEVRRYPKWKKEHGDAIFNDFGNIFGYDNLFSGDSEDSRQKRFWKWWSDGNRGGKLFGVKAVGADWVDEADIPILLNDDAIKLFAVETTLTKTEIRRRFNRLLKGLARIIHE